MLCCIVCIQEPACMLSLEAVSLAERKVGCIPTPQSKSCWGGCHSCQALGQAEEQAACTRLRYLCDNELLTYLCQRRG